MKSSKVILLALAIAAAAVVVANDVANPVPVTMATQFAWDAVTTNTVGEPVTIRSYSLGVFVGSQVLFAVDSSAPFNALGQQVATLIKRGLVYDLRVKAETTDGLVSPWSDALYIIRADGTLGKPNPPYPK